MAKQYIFKAGISADDHDAFAASNGYTTLRQSANWSKVKDNWQAEIVGVIACGSQKLLATALVLIRPLPLHTCLLYLPSGPLLDHRNPELVCFFFRELKKWAVTLHTLFIKCDPEVSYRSPDCDVIMQNYRQAGLNYGGKTCAMHATIRPRYELEVSAAAFFSSLNLKKARKKAKQAEMYALTFKITQADGLAAFNQVMEKTAQRQNVSLRNINYYRKLLKVYGKDAFLTLCYLDIKKSEESLNIRLQDCLKELHDCPLKAQKKRYKLEERIAGLKKRLAVLKDYPNDTPELRCIAGTLTVICGNRAELLYAGFDSAFKHCEAPYLTWQKTITECFKRAVTTVNLGGVDGSLKDGLSLFKKNFRPALREYIGEFDLVVNPLLAAPALYAYQRLKH